MYPHTIQHLSVDCTLKSWNDLFILHSSVLFIQFKFSSVRWGQNSFVHSVLFIFIEIQLQLQLISFDSISYTLHLTQFWLDHPMAVNQHKTPTEGLNGYNNRYEPGWFPSVLRPCERSEMLKTIHCYSRTSNIRHTHSLNRYPCNSQKQCGARRGLNWL